MTLDQLITSGAPFRVLVMEPFERHYGPAWALQLRTDGGDDLRVVAAQSPSRDNLLRASREDGLRLRVERYTAANGVAALRFKPADSREKEARQVIRLVAVPEEK